MSEPYRPSDEDVELAITQMKNEILDDMGTAISSKGTRMPMDLRTFSELHDYVDANCYGGLCDPAQRADWADHEGDMDVINRLQDRINWWLRVGAAYRQRLLMPPRVDNKNALHMVRCPHCGYEEGFSVRVASTVQVIDNGIEDTIETEWGDDDIATCGECEHTAPMKEFGIGHQRITAFDRLPYLTLGELRRRTSHLPDETPVTIGAPSEFKVEWLNAELDEDHIPEVWPHPEKMSLIIEAVNDFDTRQW